MGGRSFMVQLQCVQCSGRKTVQVMHPDGQMTEFLQPVRVSKLLRSHPHHYLCDAADNNGKILPLDAELKQGNIYLLLPLPRLFPCSPSSPSCSCYSNNKACALLSNRPGSFTMSSRRSTFLLRSKPSSSVKISSDRRKPASYPIHSQYRCAAKSSSERLEAGEKTKEMLSCRCMKTRAVRGWKPRLECILEDKRLALVKEVDRIPFQMLQAISSRKMEPRRTLVNIPDRQTQISWIHGKRSPFRGAAPLLFMC